MTFLPYGLKPTLPQKFYQELKNNYLGIGQAIL